MRVLVADDDRDLAAALTDCVQACGHEVVDTVTTGGLAVIRSFLAYVPEVVLLDIRMPRLNGYSVSHAVLSRKPDTKIIFVSGTVENTDPLIRSSGAVACLQKPVSLVELGAVLDRLAA